MLTYFLLYPSSTRVLHTETAALGLSVSVVDVTLSDAYRARSDIATSQNLVFDLVVDCFKCPFTALFTQLRHNSASLYGRLYIPRSSSSTQTLQPNSDFAPVDGDGVILTPPRSPPRTTLTLYPHVRARYDPSGLRARWRRKRALRQRRCMPR